MENGPFEDVVPIKNGVFHCYVSLPEAISFIIWMHDLLMEFALQFCHYVI